MNLLKRNWVRPLMERLEDRTVPTFTSTSLVADVSGNFTANIVTNQGVFNISYDGATSELSLDDGGAALIIPNVMGNVNITLGTTAAAASSFVTTADFVDTFAGNFNLTVNRALSAATADTNIAITTSGDAAILGNTRLTTNTPAESQITISPANALTLTGAVSVTTNGGVTTGANVRTKTFEMIPTGGAVVVGGGLSVNNLNDITITGSGASPITINGSTTLRTRPSAYSAGGEINALALTSDAVTNLNFERLQITLANTGGTAINGSTVNLNNATINSLLTAALGINAGASTTTFNFGNAGGAVQLNGGLATITGGNGSKTINVEGVSAGLARFTVALGNATANLVNFVGVANSFAYTTLVGGTGTNTVTGLIPSPFKLIRFSF
ncbi:MAG: hypothetical protein U0840_20225 [Gemmataceae bacterium]